MFYYLILAFIAGAFMPIQAALNAKLGNFVGGAIQASFISFFIGTLCLLIYLVFAKYQLSPILNITKISAHLLLGGVIGAIFVALITIMIPKLGAATMVAFVLAGQVSISLILDHFGFMGVPQHSLNLPRIIGAALIILGIYLIRRY